MASFGLFWLVSGFSKYTIVDELNPDITNGLWTITYDWLQQGKQKVKDLKDELQCHYNDIPDQESNMFDKKVIRILSSDKKVMHERKPIFCN